MLVLSNSTQQTLAPGQSIAFDNEILHTGCTNGCPTESHRNGSATVKLCRGLYRVDFNGNVAGETASVPLQLSIEASGEPLNETTMISTPSAANAFNSVAAGTYIDNRCGLCETISVTNTGTNPIIIGANANLSFRRVG